MFELPQSMIGEAIIFSLKESITQCDLCYHMSHVRYVSIIWFGIRVSSNTSNAILVLPCCKTCLCFIIHLLHQTIVHSSCLVHACRISWVNTTSLPTISLHIKQKLTLKKRKCIFIWKTALQWYLFNFMLSNVHCYGIISETVADAHLAIVQRNFKRNQNNKYMNPL
jgi:hypothetical protein